MGGLQRAGQRQQAALDALRIGEALQYFKGRGLLGGDLPGGLGQRGVGPLLSQDDPQNAAGQRAAVPHQLEQGGQQQGLLGGKGGQSRRGKVL